MNRADWPGVAPPTPGHWPAYAVDILRLAPQHTTGAGTTAATDGPAQAPLLARGQGVAAGKQKPVVHPIDEQDLDMHESVLSSCMPRPAGTAKNRIDYLAGEMARYMRLKNY